MLPSYIFNIEITGMKHILNVDGLPCILQGQILNWICLENNNFSVWLVDDLDVSLASHHRRCRPSYCYQFYLVQGTSLHSAWLVHNCPLRTQFLLPAPNKTGLAQSLCYMGPTDSFVLHSDSWCLTSCMTATPGKER